MFDSEYAVETKLEILRILPSLRNNSKYHDTLPDILWHAEEIAKWVFEKPKDDSVPENQLRDITDEFINPEKEQEFGGPISRSGPWHVVTLKFELDAGSLRQHVLRTGSGDTAELQEFSTMADVNGRTHGDGIPGKVYEFTVVKQFDDPNDAVWMCAPKAKGYLHSIDVREPTPAEVAGLL